MLLPSLIFGSQIERAGVLKVRGQNDSLVAGLSGQLDAKVPSIEGNEDEIEVLRSQVFVGKGVESVNGIAEGTSVTDMFPGQGRQAR